MSYQFNGTNQWMQTASIPISSTPLTMACWFNSSSDTTSQTAINLTNEDISTRPYMGIFIRGHIAGDPIAAFSSSGGTTASALSTSGYSANTWHHACGVFESAASRTIYLDAGNSTTNTQSVSLTPTSIRIGRFVASNGDASAYMNGRLAEVGIWSVALTQSEISSLAKGMACDRIRPQSLVFYAPLVRNIIDQKSGLTITNNNTATAAVHPRVYA